MIYISNAIYNITTKEHNIHLYVECKNAEYHCIAYNPDNNHMIGHCCFTELLYTLDNAATKAIDIMDIQCVNIKRIKRDAKAVDTTQEPDIKICLLKALAEQVHEQDYESEVIRNMLEIIKRF